MKNLIALFLLHKTAFISGAVAVTIAATGTTALLVENHKRKEKSKVKETITVSSTIGAPNNEEENLISSVEETTDNKPKLQTVIKPSTGSVLTAPEFSEKPEEDATLENQNSEKFAPQNAITVNPNVKKVVIKGSSVNVRADAGTNFASVGKVKKGEAFDYLGEKTGTDGQIWYNINGDIEGKLQSGYVRSDFAEYKIEKAPTYSGNFKDENGFRYYFDDKTGYKQSYVCIDVSSHQRNINWKSVKASGVNYAIIRVGYRGYETGALCVDKRFVENIKGAKAQGIKVGVYFYSVALNEQEAIEEADTVINALSGYNLDLPVALDMEHSADRVSGLSAAQRTTNAIAFMERIKQQGRRVMLYTYFNYYNSRLESSRLSNYILWMAYYTDNSALLGDLIFDGWQYTSSGSVSGVTGNCDVSLIFTSMITGNSSDNPLLGKKAEADLGKDEDNTQIDETEDNKENTESEKDNTENTEDTENNENTEDNGSSTEQNGNDSGDNDGSTTEDTQGNGEGSEGSSEP